MSTTYWTVEYTSGGTTYETSFQDMGYAEPHMTLNNSAMSTFEVKVPTKTLTANYTIPFEAAIVVRSGRSYSEGSYSGGSIVFQGYRLPAKRSATSAPGYDVVFGDAWYALERLIYEAEWVYKAVGAPAVSNGYFSRLTLFCDEDGNPITNGAQMDAVVDYAAACGVQIQAGTISLDAYLPFYQVRAVACSEVLTYCVRPTPDAVMWIDYSTSPPTFNCQKRSELTPISLPYKDGSTHSSGEITPRPDLQVPVVIIQYQKQWTLNSYTWADFWWDVYPTSYADANGKPLSTARTLRAVVLPIDLRPGYRQDVKQTVVARTVDADCVTDYSWWILNKPDLSAPVSPALDGVYDLTIQGSASAVDDDGNEVSLASYPRQLLSGNILSWMTSLSAVRATVTAKFSYSRKDENGKVVEKVEASKPHAVSVRVVLTNAPAGTNVYKTVGSVDMGESPAEDLAQSIYNSCSALHWEGTHVLAERDTSGNAVVQTSVGPWNTLNLTGGQSAWSSMAAAVQTVSVDFFRAVTTVSFGPPPHLSPSETASITKELAFMWRYRWATEPLTLRGSGYTDVSSSVEVGGLPGYDNVSAPPPVRSYHKLTSKFTE